MLGFRDRCFACPSLDYPCVLQCGYTAVIQRSAPLPSSLKSPKEFTQGVPLRPIRLRTQHRWACRFDRLTQWVEDLALPQAAAQVTDAAWIQACCGCGISLSCSSSSAPGVERSICCRCSPKKNERKKKKKHKWAHTDLEISQNIFFFPIRILNSL